MNHVPKMVLSTLVFITNAQSAAMVPVEISHHKYGRDVFVRAVKFERDDACVYFNAGMSAGDFFKSLEKVTTPSGVVFRKKSQIIDEFPPSIEVMFLATATQCSALPRLNAPPASVIPVIGSAHFTARCGSEHDEKHLQVSEKQKHFVPGGLSATWLYKLDIHSEGCLLAEPLTIDMSSDDGSLITQFFGQL